MRRVLIAAAAAAMCVSQLPTSTAAVPLGGLADSSARAGSHKVHTKFGLSAAGYGTRVQGGSLPANSEDTAYQRIGCTNIAGIDRNNYEADLVLPGLGKAEGVRTHVWTAKRGDTVSSYSKHTIARLILGSSPLGSVEIQGISSLSQAFNDNGRFGTKVTSEIARIIFKPTGAPAQQLAIPAPGQTLTIPGVASISLGKTVRKVTRVSAKVAANVVDITVIPSGTRTRVAQTNAAILGGIRHGVFAGYGAGVEARGLADNLKVGRTPLKIVPCVGTRGKPQGKDIAGVDLGALGNLRSVAAGVTTTNRARLAKGTVAGRVASVSLLGDRVQINGVLGVANVTRKRGVISRNSKGSTVGQIIVDGQSYTIPALGSLEILGIVKLQSDIETRLKFGLKVVGLRVTVLDGSGAVVDLGVAQLGIRRGVKAGS